MNLKDNFEPFSNSLKQAIQDENWYAALITAVTLPDICCTLDGTKKGKHSKDPYIVWFNKYVGKYHYEVQGYASEIKPNLKVYINGNNAYSLRCDVLHQGGTDLTSHSSTDSELGYQKIEFIFPNEIPIKILTNEFFSDISALEIGSTLYLNVKTYCNSILTGVLIWLDDQENKYQTKIKSEKLIKIWNSKNLKSHYPQGFT